MGQLWIYIKLLSLIVIDVRLSSVLHISSEKASEDFWNKLRTSIEKGHKSPIARDLIYDISSWGLLDSCKLTICCFPKSEGDFVKDATNQEHWSPGIRCSSTRAIMASHGIWFIKLFYLPRSRSLICSQITALLHIMVDD